MKILVAVAIGGAIGAIARFQLSQSFIKSFSGDFIYHIMVANIIGCFLMGVCYEFMNLKMNVGLEWRAFFMVGVLSSFTTFSSSSIKSRDIRLYGSSFIVKIATASSKLYNRLLFISLS